MKLDPIKVLPLIHPILRIWYFTIRFSQENIEKVQGVKGQGRGVIYALWHNELFAPIFLHRNQRISIMVSESRDGELISRILERFGYMTIRGSSTRGGVRALKHTITSLKDSSRDMAITVDGPLGPRHVVKDGIIYLAWKLNRPIVPVRTFCSFKKTFHKSWDKFELPLPFSRCVVVYGTPYYLNHQKINSAILEKERENLENRLRLLKPKVSL